MRASLHPSHLLAIGIVASSACGPSIEAPGDDDGALDTIDSAGFIDTESMDEGGPGVPPGGDETARPGGMESDDDTCQVPECGVDLECGVVRGCGTTVDCGPCDAGVVEEVEPTHIVADPVRGRVYVTVHGSATTFANELVVVDGEGSVVDSVFVGSNPSTLAISDDASTLWVGLDGSDEIIEVDLTGRSPVPGTSYSLPQGDFGQPATAGPMVVLAGTTDSIAVSLHQQGGSPSFVGLAVLDGGVPRPVQTPGHTGASRITKGPAGWLFGFNEQHTGFEFYAIEAHADGPVQQDFSGLVDGFQTDIVYAGGRVYATSGQVVDVSDPSAPHAAGTFTFWGEVLPQPELGRVLMLSPQDSFRGTGAALRSLDIATFTEIQSTPLTGLGSDEFDDLVSPDGAVLAFIGRDFFDEPPRLHVVPNPFAR